LVGRNRFTEEIALIGRTLLHAKKGELIPRFDSLSHNVKIEGTPHPDNRSHDRGIDFAEFEVLDEGLIDFQRIDRESLKIGEGGVALYLESVLFMLPMVLNPSGIGRRSRGPRDRGTAWVVTLLTWKARTVAWATKPASCKAGLPWRIQ